MSCESLNISAVKCRFSKWLSLFLRCKISTLNRRIYFAFIPCNTLLKSISRNRYSYTKCYYKTNYSVCKRYHLGICISICLLKQSSISRCLSRTLTESKWNQNSIHRIHSDSFSYYRSSYNSNKWLDCI